MTEALNPPAFFWLFMEAFMEAFAQKSVNEEFRQTQLLAYKKFQGNMDMVAPTPPESAPAPSNEGEDLHRAMSELHVTPVPEEPTKKIILAPPVTRSLNATNTDDCQGNTIISVTRPPTKIKQEREMREREREEREIERREVWLNGSKRSHQ